ncbi:MAG: hypothetical protein QOH45_1829, partial [Pseudonocardiales bacterium]|nr:hypothetical protein [Pseudonocardiales bacterium]
FDEVGLEHRPEAMQDAAHWLTSRTAQLFHNGLPWRPGALAALRLVRASGLATALVTSTERRLVEQALDSIGREFFDQTVSGDEVPATKPAPGRIQRDSLAGLTESELHELWVRADVA